MNKTRLHCYAILDTWFPYIHTFLSLPQLSCVTLLGGRERARKRERKRGWWKMEVSGVREKYKGTRGNHCGSWVSYKKGDHVCVPDCLRKMMDGSAHYHWEGKRGWLWENDSHVLIMDGEIVQVICLYSRGNLIYSSWVWWGKPTVEKHQHTATAN